MHAVLVVDDDPGTLEQFGFILRKHQYVVVVASSGEEAFCILQQRPLHLALVDMRLPGISGLEIVRRARASAIDVPFVMMTGFGMDRAAVDAMQLGAKDFVEKPIFVEQLLELVKRYAVCARPTEAARASEDCDNLHVAKALRIIAEEFSDPALGLRTIATRGRISPEHLARLFRDVTGETLETRLRRTRLQSGRVWLETTKLRVGDVAARCGYRDASMFAADFRSQYGVSPREFRYLKA